MKKLFEIPQLNVVRFETADIIITSDCGEWWYCSSLSWNGYNGYQGGTGIGPGAACNDNYTLYSSGYGDCSSFRCDSFGI